MTDNGNDPAPSSFPMPGRTDFSAEEEKAMRNSQGEPEEDELSRAIGDSLKKTLNRRARMPPSLSGELCQ